jgi:hypothetical protein
MTSPALTHTTLTQEVNNVSSALSDLATATRQLVAALFKSLLQVRHRDPVSTARQEADKLRAYADSLYRADPRYAQDLYAAATRHELAASAE